MGLHHQGSHAKVVRGLEAQDKLKHLKRGDSAHINLNNAPDSNAAQAQGGRHGQRLGRQRRRRDGGVQTIVSLVYQTVSADFTGPTAGYVTVTPSNAAASPATVTSASATVITTSVATVSPTTSGYSSSSTAPSTEDGSNNKSMFLNPPASAVAAYSSTAAATVAAGTPVSATHVNEAISNSSDGMSGGAKAGLAIGICLAIALCAGLLVFCFLRKKNPNNRNEMVDEKRASNASSFFGGKAMSEKHASIASDSTSARAASTAPRLSLRPVTQFLPNINEKRKSSGTNLDAAPAMSEKPKSMWERRTNNTENPFADASGTSEKDARPVSTPSNPFDEPEGKSEEKQGSLEPETPGKVGTAASAVAVAAAGTPGAKASNNVHRVQLDFKPSMDDELELKSGQLVRVLHEYDDGWALCIRMDRTQQGVAPRTCLSKLPVKPRPQGPPPPPGAQNARPMTPTGPPGMMPRPLTPTQRERSGSNAAAPAEASAGVPARKPVPGQAL
ncbi:Src-like 3 domains [Teratosphaeria destructans]|uniref:Src-like 3 domains n=1 Tax=Teratosphaeria destructans TaxID=418781 RepID=A0A9W7SSK2_9PEZI|nr:Src-like 3 domains [Teratosphaeria destructans]